MKDVMARILKPTEAAREFTHAQSQMFLDEYLASLGHTVRDFRSPAWGDELRAWIVSQVSLFRTGGFHLYGYRDPAASAIYWMLKFLEKSWPYDDAEDFIVGIRSSVLAVATDPTLVMRAEKIARDHRCAS
jgi:hypothetical protein